MRLHFPAALPVLLAAVTCAAQIPVRGVPVPELSWLDSEMTQLMEDNDISGGLLGIMRNGVIIYQRGFGWHDEARTIGMPENALVRVASWPSGRSTSTISRSTSARSAAASCRTIRGRRWATAACATCASGTFTPIAAAGTATRSAT